jgi:plasmid stabilization system protein ParE
MTLPLEYRAEVHDEIVEAYRWHEAQRQGLGEEFLAEVRDQLDRIQENPEAHAVLYRKVRACLIQRFKYVIYYRFLEDSINVIAVQHGHRNPRAWRRRA